LNAVALVRDQRHGAEVPGEIVTQLSYGDFVATQRNWDEVKESAAIRIEAADESDSWDWPRKFSQRKGEHRFLGLRVAGRLEGLLQVSLNWVPARNNGETRAALLYVEHIETAPWNQERYVGKQHRVYQHVGLQLIHAAGRLSLAEGFRGRLGLHSLPLSAEFYRRLQLAGKVVFQELGLGFWEYPSLGYFETVDE